MEVHCKKELKTYDCLQCGKIFQSKRGFTIHMRIHDGRKRSSCEICSKQFKLFGGLKNHMKRVHSGEKPFACKRCKRRFAEADLEKHRDDHSSGNLRLPCSECELTFAWKSCLDRHRQKIHNSESDRKITSNKRKKMSNLSWNDHKKESSSDDDPENVLDSTDMEESDENSRHPSLAPRSHPTVGTQSENPSESSSTIEGSFGRVNTRPRMTYGCGVCNRSFLTKEETIKCFNGHD